MKFEITNPNYSPKALEEITTTVIDRHEANPEKDANMKNDKKNPALSVGKSK